MVIVSLRQNDCADLDKLIGKIKNQLMGKLVGKLVRKLVRKLVELMTVFIPLWRGFDGCVNEKRL